MHYPGPFMVCLAFVAAFMLQFTTRGIMEPSGDAVAFGQHGWNSADAVLCYISFKWICLDFEYGFIEKMFLWVSIDD